MGNHNLGMEPGQIKSGFLKRSTWSELVELILHPLPKQHSSRWEHIARGTNRWEHIARGTSRREHIARGTSRREHIARGTSRREHIARGTSRREHIARGTSRREHTARGTSRREHIARGTSRRSILHVEPAGGNILHVEPAGGNILHVEPAGGNILHVEPAGGSILHVEPTDSRDETVLGSVPPPSPETPEKSTVRLQEAPPKPEETEAEPFMDSSLFAHWGQDLSPENRRAAFKQFQYYGYNAYLSDRLPLDRATPDLRPAGCKNLTFSENLPQISIAFIYVNEALSVILRSIRSAIDRTPAHLLKEIILVDDHSNNEELREKLSKYVEEMNQQKPGFIKTVRHSKQEGLIRSRVSGWRAATAPVVALFDAHVEFSTGWAEPVLNRIKEDRKIIISPSFDNIKYDTFEIMQYMLTAQSFDWQLWCRYMNPRQSWWKRENTTAPIKSPALIGCFIVDRLYFEEIGLLDEGMEVYGGENVELGIRAWQCGGSVEVLPCARVAHIERAHKPYTGDLAKHVRRNALRVAEVWMDEFKNHVYMAWNVPLEDSGIDIGDISDRKALRKRLQCKTFRWYLVTAYPEMRTYPDNIAYGVLQNSIKPEICVDQGPTPHNIPILYICHGFTPQIAFYTRNELIHVGNLSPTTEDEENRCLVDVNSQPRLIDCAYAKAKRMKMHWHFAQGGSIQNRKTNRCLEVQENSNNDFGYHLVLQQCSGQSWSITNFYRNITT
uniref:Polypeptide N-acetylgalactosaminyltransferase n=1 Tax=Leptobrachium leishanense TaxID=445787 RepID=A0A8C5QC34_9ANUR